MASDVTTLRRNLDNFAGHPWDCAGILRSERIEPVGEGEWYVFRCPVCGFTTEPFWARLIPHGEGEVLAE